MSEIKTVKVNASGQYEVIIGSGLLEKSGEIINGVIPVCKIALITDDIVDGLYSKIVTNSLEKAGYSVVKFVFNHGEESKNLTTYGQILSFLAKNQLTRTDAIVALGGGVVGDMAGFAAATYLRGIKYAQIPTTLLAQVDSSVGGKTAVDLPEGKNLVGAFYQPKVVICDATALKTLPESVYKEGMGEVTKYAVLDEKVFAYLNGENDDIKELVYLCVDYKRRIVEEDEFEGGKRKLLNLGHTPAHGIELLSNYAVPHGNAVTQGLTVILNASFKHGLIDKETLLKANEVIKKCVGETPLSYDLKEICVAALNDKKRSGDYINVVMVYGIGDCRAVKIKVDELWGYLS